MQSAQATNWDSSEFCATSDLLYPKASSLGQDLGCFNASAISLVQLIWWSPCPGWNTYGTIWAGFLEGIDTQKLSWSTHCIGFKENVSGSQQSKIQITANISRPWARFPKRSSSRALYREISFKTIVLASCGPSWTPCKHILANVTILWPQRDTHIGGFFTRWSPKKMQEVLAGTPLSLWRPLFEYL